MQLALYGIVTGGRPSTEIVNVALVGEREMMAERVKREHSDAHHSWFRVISRL